MILQKTALERKYSSKDLHIEDGAIIDFLLCKSEGYKTRIPETSINERSGKIVQSVPAVEENLKKMSNAVINKDSGAS